MFISAGWLGHSSGTSSGDRNFDLYVDGKKIADFYNFAEKSKTELDFQSRGWIGIGVSTNQTRWSE